MSFAGGFLQQGKVMIGIRRAIAIPVDDEGGYSPALRLLNLFAKNRGIVARITYIQVGMVTEPWHVDGEQFGHRRWRASGGQRMTNDGGVATSRHYQEGHNQRQDNCRQTTTPVLAVCNRE